MQRHMPVLALLAAAVAPALAQDAGLAAFASEVASVALAASQDAQNPSSAGPADPQTPGAEPNPLRDARDRIYYPGDSERLKPLTRKLAGNVLMDQKEIWTSPFHMRDRDAKWWLGFGGLTAALIATDTRSSKLLTNSKGQIAWGNNLSKIGTSYTLLPVVAGFYGFGVITDDPKAREVAVLGGEALLDSLIVVSVLKPIAGRNRPDAKDDPGSFFDGGVSFPSGHAIEAWSLASVISYEYGHTKLVPVIAMGLAGVVSAARFAAQQHYASDILAGGAMGWFIGRYVWKTHQDHAIHVHSPGFHPQVVPQIQPGTHTYGVALMLNN